MLTGHLLVPGPRIGGTAIAGFDGRWSVMGRQVLTAVGPAAVTDTGVPGRVRDVVGLSVCAWCVVMS